MNGRHFGARLHDHVIEGYRAVALENEILRVEVLVDKGSDIISFLHKPSDTDFMWHREVGLQRAGLGAEPRGDDEFVFVDQYEGGWQECLPNGGQAVLYKGARLPFHGELLTRPFGVDVVEDRPEVVSVRLMARTLRTPLVLEKTLTLRSGEAVLAIDERLTNLADEDLDIMWGHHPAFGPPFLDGSCRIDVPPCRATTERAEPWPDSGLRYAECFDWPAAPLKTGGTRDLSLVTDATSGIADWVRLEGFEEGWYGITNVRSRVGFGLRWDRGLFRHLWYWHVYGGMRGYPWWGLNYDCALEPWTSWPDGGLARAIDNGSALRVGARGVIETRILAVAYAGLDRVGGIDAGGNVR